MKKLVLFLTVIVLFIGCKKDKSPGEGSEMPALPTKVAKIQVAPLVCTYTYPAYIQANQVVTLVARVSGYLEEINYTPGIVVKKGKPLFAIETTTYKNLVESAEATLEKANSEVEYAKANYYKMKNAYREQAVSEIDVLQAKSSYYTALAAVLDAKSALSNAKLNLSYCRITAPSTGIVTTSVYDVGNYLDAAANPPTLATFYSTDYYYAHFSMAYPEYVNLTTNLISQDSIPITLTDPTSPGKTWKGKLDYSSPNVNQTTGTVKLRGIVKNTSQDLLSGLYLNIAVPYRYVKEALLIPEISIGTDQAGRYILVVNKDDIVEKKSVKVGFLNSDGMREIVSGASANEIFVQDGLITVRPGEKIKPYMDPRK